MEIGDIAALAATLDGVRHCVVQGCTEWRYHGRLVARQLDHEHLLARCDFDYRDSLLKTWPGTFTVPIRYVKHMIIVADLVRGDPEAIEDAVEGALNCSALTSL